jgi:hypothetical protein
MKLGFWKLKVTAGIGNKGNRPYGMFNQSDQPTQPGHSSHLESPYQQRGCQLAQKISMMWQIMHVFFSILSFFLSLFVSFFLSFFLSFLFFCFFFLFFLFWYLVFIFYPTDGASRSHKMVSQNSPFNLCADFHTLGLLARLLHKICTSLLPLVSDLCMLYHNFYYVVTYMGLAWLRVVGSWFDDWVYWIFVANFHNSLGHVPYSSLYSQLLFLLNSLFF